MLDFLLRFLSRAGKDGWLGDLDDEDVPLEGFHWRGGAERDTTGILMWSKVFEVKLPSGKDVAVVLMDTQGAFDSNRYVHWRIEELIGCKKPNGQLQIELLCFSILARCVIAPPSLLYRPC